MVANDVLVYAEKCAFMEALLILRQVGTVSRVNYRLSYTIDHQNSLQITLFKSAAFKTFNTRLSEEQVPKEAYPVADLEGVPWVPWNPPFEELPSFNSQCA